MAITAKASALVSSGSGALFTFNIGGFYGDLKKLFLVSGSAPTAPALVSDFVGSTQADGVLNTVSKSINVGPGASAISGTESMAVSGSEGDLWWVAAVLAAGSAPVGTDAVLAVAGPFTVQA